ncbi:MAG: aminoacyl-tRNA hydrolase [Alphaproteobacteria bacterium]|nr:aminoacyl-tRNA hydrolase [Alphaproteobacteria bacterium]
MDTFLITGLGNPGPQYVRNRHNIGFRVVDTICGFYAFEPFRLKDSSLISEGRLENAKIIALKPQTYMNRSGQAVSTAARFYKITPDKIIVIHDDIELKPGIIRIKQDGGHGGHNGLKDIDAHIGSGYWRMRFGVGHPGHRDLVAQYVLGDFSKSDETWIEPLVDDIAREFSSLISNGAGTFLNNLALRRQPLV